MQGPREIPTNCEPLMCQQANPVTEWGRGRQPPPKGVGKASPGYGYYVTTSQTR